MHKIIESSGEKSRISMMRANEVESHFLEEMLNALKNKYDFVSLDEMYSRLKSEKKYKKKFLAVTFDDGYKDNLILAHPILKKLGVPFTIYITNSFPNYTAKLWWYMLEDILLENDEIMFKHKNIEYKFLAKTQRQKDDSFVKIRAIIINATKDENEDILFQLGNNYNKKLDKYVQKEALTWEDIKYLSKDPIVTIGCHTVNHLALNTLTDTEVLEEIEISKNEIESYIGIKVDHFAFPYGTSNEVNQREVNLLKACESFLTATTTRMGNIFHSHNQSFFALPRIQVLGNQQDHSILEMYLCGMLPAIKNKLKRIVTL